jgi:hypothetical protein
MEPTRKLQQATLVTIDFRSEHGEFSLDLESLKNVSVAASMRERGWTNPMLVGADGDIKCRAGRRNQCRPGSFLRPKKSTPNAAVSVSFWKSKSPGLQLRPQKIPPTPRYMRLPAVAPAGNPLTEQRMGAHFLNRFIVVNHRKQMRAQMSIDLHGAQCIEPETLILGRGGF